MMEHPEQNVDDILRIAQRQLWSIVQSKLRNNTDIQIVASYVAQQYNQGKRHMSLV